MKTKKTESPESFSNSFIDFEETPIYSGKLKGFGKIINDGKENLFLDFDDGKKVGLSVMIKKVLRYAKKNKGLAIGDEIKFEFKGKTKTKDGKPLNIFEVAINGSLINPDAIEGDEFFDSILQD